MTGLILRLAPYIGAVVIVGLSLFGAYHHGETVTNNAWQVKWDQAVQKQQNQVQALRQKIQTEQANHRQQMAAVDAKYQEQIQHDQQTHDRDLLRLNSGALRLRKRFTCSTPSHNAVPKATKTASSSHATEGGGLRKADAEFLIRLADRADQVTHQLQACQATIKAGEGSP